MSPRKSKVTDQMIFEAARRVMARSDGTWTLKHVADEVGLTGGALWQRFGSRRELEVKLAKYVAAATPGQFTWLQQQHASPLSALYAYASEVAKAAELRSRQQIYLVDLQHELQDPKLRKALREQAINTQAGFREILERAIQAGELALNGKSGTAALARAVETVMTGSVLTWAYQDIPAEEWLRADLDALLAPFRTRPLGKAERKNSRGKKR